VDLRVINTSNFTKHFSVL